jgi:hypothetical protein
MAERAGTDCPGHTCVRLRLLLFEEYLEMRRVVRISLGTMFILLGIAGLVLPVLQGWLFLALGSLLLSVDLPFFERPVQWLEKRIPQIQNPLERVRQYLKGPDEK